MSAAVAETQRPTRPEFIGRYRILGRIGKGAMGVVYSAYDDVMGRDVAVKVMMTDYEGEPDIRARFIREAQVSAKLAHRNIVTIFDIGEDNGRLFIVMELLRGETLAECIRQRTLPIEKKVSLILEVCEGLSVANAAGVCHRDVKPGNLFLQEDGGVKILDFGIARLASSSMTASGFILGTPDYMSPEQARGVAVDERSDIFSVGAVLYLLLSGRKPFTAPDLPAVLHKVVSEEPPPIGGPEVPPPLARVVLKALAKDPAHRFQSFRELSAELTSWRRRYEAETRMLAAEVARKMDALPALASDERKASAALNMLPETDVDACMSEIAAGYPELMSSGVDALRSFPWNRDDVQEIDNRINALTAVWAPRIARLRSAAEELATATSLLEGGDPRGALSRFENVLRQVPSAGIHTFIERARSLVAAQQAREHRLRNLLGEAAVHSANGRFDAALALAQEAIKVDPESHEARELLSCTQQDLRAAEAENARRCERYLQRARRAVELQQLDEADRQLQLARETGAERPEIALVGAAVAEARAARDKANAVLQEIAGELGRAREQFQEGDRQAALAHLEGLASRHPSSTAVLAEMVRLKAEDERRTSAEHTKGNADRLAANAATALEQGDDQAAARLAEEALMLVPSHELALRTSAVAHAHSRERAERAAREERARRFIARAEALLARGRFERAVREARRAAELDPTGSAAPALIAETFRREAEAAAAGVRAREEASRAAELREAIAAATRALRSQNFVRARMLAERAVALDPDSTGPKELVAKIAAAAALAEAALEDETVDLQKGLVDPDATVAIPLEGDGRIWSSLLRLRLFLLGVWLSGVVWARFRRRGTVKSGSADVPPGQDPHKEP